MAQNQQNDDSSVSISFLAEMREKYFPKQETPKEPVSLSPDTMGAPTGNFQKYINDTYVVPAAKFKQQIQEKFAGDFDTLFSKVIQAESRGQHRTATGRLTTSKAGAQGITQIMPDTGKKPGYGIAPLKDDSEEEYLRVGRSLLKAYTDKFDGDYAKGLAAYNWGPGNLSKAIEKHGVNWRDALPAETSKYLKKILGNRNG